MRGIAFSRFISIKSWGFRSFVLYQEPLPIDENCGGVDRGEAHSTFNTVHGSVVKPGRRARIAMFGSWRLTRYNKKQDANRRPLF